MSSATKTPKNLDKHAETVRKELAVPKQNEVFRVAVEAGYLSALADGEVDAAERKAIAHAVEVLSVGAVIEWETEALLDECAARVAEEGADARARAIGAALKELRQPDAGLLFAAFVAEASGGVDGKESAVLESIGKAAGLAKGKLGGIVKKARGK